MQSQDYNTTEEGWEQEQWANNVSYQHENQIETGQQSNADIIEQIKNFLNQNQGQTAEGERHALCKHGKGTNTTPSRGTKTPILLVRITHYISIPTVRIPPLG